MPDALTVIVVIGLCAAVVIFGDRLLDWQLDKMVRNRALPYDIDETDRLPRLKAALEPYTRHDWTEADDAALTQHIDQALAMGNDEDRSFDVFGADDIDRSLPINGGRPE